MYNLAVFDMDGTLLDTVHDLAVSGNYALRIHAFPERETEAYKHFAGNGVHNLILRALAPVDDADTVAKVEAAFREHYADHAQDRTKPYPGITEALAALKAAGVKLAVLSNKPDAYTRILAEQYFPGVFDIAYGQRPGVPLKPDPTALLGILREADCMAEQCIYIGDTAVDVETAHSAGLACIGVLWGFRTEKELQTAGADIIINKCIDLINIIVDKSPHSRLY